MELPRAALEANGLRRATRRDLIGV
jgi:hypothetical protein